MKINAPAENTIIVELSSQDMRELDITFDEMDYSNLETKRVIWTVLDKVSHTLGRSIDTTGKLSVEAMPDGAGGCMLLFNLVERKKQKPHSPALCYVYETADFGVIQDLTEALGDNPHLCSASLYEKTGKYRLCVSADADSAVSCQISEYLPPVEGGEQLISSTDEHWKCLCKGNALSMLRRKR